MKPGLYVTATPIGHLGDVSDRVRTTLADVDLIVCEDTRVTGKLLHHLGLKNTLWSYHDHNAAEVRPKIVARLQDGAAIALTADAGTPLISDPGYKLVRDARDAGIPVVSVPGPSALTAALSVAGLPTDRVFFGGFLPAKAGPRRKALEDLKQLRATLVFFAGGGRVAGILNDLADTLGERDAVICRELTKMHEEVVSGPLAELAKDSSRITKGEFVILIGPPSGDPAPDQEALDALILAALEQQAPSRAAASVAQQTGLPKRRIYARALELNKPR